MPVAFSATWAILTASQKSEYPVTDIRGDLLLFFHQFLIFLFIAFCLLQKTGFLIFGGAQGNLLRVLIFFQLSGVIFTDCQSFLLAQKLIAKIHDFFKR